MTAIAVRFRYAFLVTGVILSGTSLLFLAARHGGLLLAEVTR